ncbi:hypothetical protein GY45DRAFT_1336052 [Cubamyces sp. BRFM 1775]|nr:hypothetical protein GY45DRAFT_1336052 [Cubamyces sp. BRFM 1775]
MYRPPSPVYDVPELPTLRRVKPLPKRRRTSGSAPHDHLDSAAIPGSGGGGTPDLTANSTTSTNTPALGQQDADGHTTAQDGEDGLPPSTLDLDGHATTPPDTLTAQMALQAYYMPVLGGVRDLFKASPPDSRASTPLDLSSALAGLGTGLNSGNGYGYGYSYGYGGGGMPGAYMDGRDGGDDDESGEGDYVDHLQQPGNTKKRKVPANMSGSAHGHDSGSTGSGAEDEPADRAIPTGRERDAEAGSVGVGGGGGLGGGGGTGISGGTGVGLSLAAQAALGRSGGGLGGGRRGRLTRATFAGLQHKEMLRSRKRQLAAVLGALAHGDTLALDQALSASYPFVQTGIDYRSGAPVRVRLSRRREARLARAYKAYKEALAVDQPGHTESPADAEAEVASEKKDSAKSSPSKPGKQKQQTKSQTQAARDRQVQEQPQPLPSAAATTTPPPKVPSSEFSFVCHSATSDRLVATKEEVAQLHSRFEEELARQAAKAAEAAKQAAAAAAESSGPNGPVAKRTDRTKQGAAGSGKAGGGGGDGKADPAQPGGAGAGTGTKSGGKSGKKKKRSALANASNPHHLRNYVPTRLPHSGPPNAQQAAQNAQNLLSPPPLRFLSAEIPPRRPRKKSTAAGAGAGPGAGAPASAPAPVAPATTLTNPAEEWICPFCEYQLFYGDESSYHRAVRNRKKILRRRRRARERAAAAASGVAPAAPAPAAASTGGEKGEHEDAVLDAPVAAVREPAPSPGKAAKWKEGDRGGRGVQAAAHA